MHLAVGSEDQRVLISPQLVFAIWVEWRLEPLSEVWMSLVVRVVVVTGSMLIDFVHIVDEDLVLTGVEVLLQLLVLVQKLLLVLLLMKLIQHVLDV